MRWHLDHVFVATPDPGAEALATEFGLAFTERRRHVGQGTANACALFENAYLELLFPAEAEELESEVVRPLGLKERIEWERTGACPFGICFRPEELVDDAASAFETWPYRPSYLPPGSRIPIVTPPGQLLEPLIFLMKRPRPSGAEPGVEHRGAKRTITAVIIHSPHEVASRPSKWFFDQGLVSLERSAEYLLEIVWDDRKQRKTERLGRSLPLAFSW